MKKEPQFIQTGSSKDAIEKQGGSKSSNKFEDIQMEKNRLFDIYNQIKDQTVYGNSSIVKIPGRSYLDEYTSLSDEDLLELRIDVDQELLVDFKRQEVEAIFNLLNNISISPSFQSQIKKALNYLDEIKTSLEQKTNYCFDTDITVKVYELIDNLRELLEEIYDGITEMTNGKDENKEYVETEEESKFHNWVLDEAKKHEDYIKFYESAINKFLDLTLEYGKTPKLGSPYINNVTIRSEAYKIAKKDDQDFVRATNCLTEIFTEVYKHRDLYYYNPQLDSKISRKTHQIKLDEKEKYHEKIKSRVADILRDYKNKSGQDWDSVRRELHDKLSLLTYGGALSSKIKEVNNKLGTAMENVINYPLDPGVSDAKRDLQFKYKLKEWGWV
jgi:hypothetical protein